MKDIDVLKRRVSRNISLVEKAIKKGVYLSQVEWFDFLFKASFVGYSSKSTKYHKVFNKDMYRLAECFSEVFSAMLDVNTNGYDNYVLASYAKRVASRFNKYPEREGRFKVSSHDKNGYLFVIICCGRVKPKTFTVGNVNDAIDMLIGVVGYCMQNVNSTSLSTDFTNFLTGYLGNEYTKFSSDVEPTPIVDNDKYVFSDFMRDYNGVSETSQAVMYEGNFFSTDRGGKILAIS